MEQIKRFRKAANAVRAANTLNEGTTMRPADDKLHDDYNNQDPEPPDDPQYQPSLSAQNGYAQRPYPAYGTNNPHGSSADPRTPGSHPNQHGYNQQQWIPPSHYANPVHHQQGAYPNAYPAYTHASNPPPQNPPYSPPLVSHQPQFPPNPRPSTDSYASSHQSYGNNDPYNQPAPQAGFYHQSSQSPPQTYANSPPPLHTTWSDPTVPQTQPPAPAPSERTWSYDQASTYASTNAPSLMTQRTFSMPQYCSCDARTVDLDEHGRCRNCGR